jgi:hypothetical protein
MIANAPHLALRSPLALPKNHPPTSIDSARDENRYSEERDDAFLPWIGALQAASEVLDLSVEAQFTASVLLHRYRSLSGEFRVQSKISEDGTLRSDRVHSDNPSSEMFAIAACLFVACKVENEPRQLRDVVHCALQLRVRKQSYEMDGDPSTRTSSTKRNDPVLIAWNPTLLDVGSSTEPYSDARYKRAQQGVLAAEQLLLRWLGFDVQVSHPHRMVVLITQNMMTTWLGRNSDDDGSHFLFQTLMDQWRLDAWQRLNSAVFCADCLGHDVASLACASMDLELPPTSASLEQISSNSFGSDSPNDQRSILLFQADWYLAVPGVSKESVSAARLDLENIAYTCSFRNRNGTHNSRVYR